MFERFTDRARRVVVLAQEEAVRLNHNYIGTEHLMLALLHEAEGRAAQALGAAGVTLEKARALVEEIVGRGTQPAAGHIPFTARAKKVQELALREALQLGHNYIGTEHLLLGLAREAEGVGAQVLAKFDVVLADLREKLLEYSDDEQVPKNARPTIHNDRLASVLSRLSDSTQSRRVVDYQLSSTERSDGQTVDVLTIKWAPQ